MRKIILGFVATAAIASPLALAASANADAPDGTYQIAPKANDHASAIGKQSAQITQNGQFVSGQYNDRAGWQNQGNQRGQIVQDTLGH